MALKLETPISIFDPFSLPPQTQSVVKSSSGYLQAAQDTMRPILKRATWSLKCALAGRRPQANIAASEGFDLTRREKASSGTALASKFAVTEYKGDWAWLKFFFEIDPYWKKGTICYRCSAARIPRHCG